MLPAYLREGAAIRTRDFKDALIRTRIGAEHIGSFLKRGSGTHDDLAIGEAQGPPYSQGYRIAFRARLHSVGFINQEHPHIVAAQVSGRLRSHNLEAPAGKATGKKRVSPAAFAFTGQETMQSGATIKDWFQVAGHVIAAVILRRLDAKDG